MEVGDGETPAFLCEPGGLPQRVGSPGEGVLGCPDPWPRAALDPQLVLGSGLGRWSSVLAHVREGCRQGALWKKVC